MSTELIESFFAQADADKSGTLTKLETCKILTKTGLTVQQVNDIFDDVDVSGDGLVTLDELKKALDKRDPRDVQEAELRAAFKKFDADNSGSITVAELKEVLDKMGLEDTAEGVIKQVDSNQDGKVDFEEFLKMWRDGL